MSGYISSFPDDENLTQAHNFEAPTLMPANLLI